MFPRRLARSSVAAVRRFSGNASAAEVATEDKLNKVEIFSADEKASTSPARGQDTLGRRLFAQLKVKHSAVAVIRQWKEEGRAVRRHELGYLVREMRKRKRYRVALQISEWMVTQEDMKLVPSDCVVHLDLVARIHGLSSAEKFFADLPEKMRNSATCCTLLHIYVQHKEPDKAEALMKKMSECGFLNSPLPFNHMLSLYNSIRQFEKVPNVIEALKRVSSPDIHTYNLWLASCVSQNLIEAAEEVFIELEKGKIEPDWLTYSTLTSIYTKNSLLEKAESALKDMEKKVSKETRAAFPSLISLHAGMGHKDDVLRIWKNMKSNYRRLSDAEYTCMITSLLKLKELEEGEKLYYEWEAVSPTKDSRISNLLLAGYINNDQMEKAERFYNHMLEKNIKPGYTTLELLTWGYLKQRNAEKAVDCFKKAVKSVRKWDLDEKLLREVCSIVEELGNIDCAEKLMIVLRRDGYVNTEMYNSLLRTYANAGEMPLTVEERMKKDKVAMDEETKMLLSQVTSKTHAC